MHVEDNLLTLPRDLGGVQPQKSLRESRCGPPAPNPQCPGGGDRRPLSGTRGEAQWGGEASWRGLELEPVQPGHSSNPSPVLWAKWLFPPRHDQGDLSGGSRLSLWTPKPDSQTDRQAGRPALGPRTSWGLWGGDALSPRAGGRAHPGTGLLAARRRRSPSTLPPRLFSPPQLINLN